MANRLMVRNLMTLEKAPVNLYMQAAIGSTGAITLSAIKSMGIRTATRTGVGAYTLALGGPAGVDTYQRLLMASFSLIGASTTTVGMIIIEDNSANSTPTVKVQFIDGTGAAVEIGSGITLLVKLELSNSTAK